MAARVPEMFSITESALNVIRSLVAQQGYVAYICWSTTLSNPPSEGWDVVSFEESECADPVEFSGIRFLFDPQRADELSGKTLDWINGYGFRVT